MEHCKGIMMGKNNFSYQPLEYESEKASNSYVMSLIAVVAGLPLPIINLAATLIFYMGNRKQTYFVRWHCTQALLSQSSLLIINTAGVIWSLMILFKSSTVTSNYIAYIIAVLVFNAAEFIATVDAAVRIRKGEHVEWFFYGNLTNLVCKR
ncbi:MAG TPA: DUF4870 domain-containing protein [Bacteroidales bacterium]|nr:DUF4870 domain-containing protein [Bacteroidales bacterium]